MATARGTTLLILGKSTLLSAPGERRVVERQDLWPCADSFQIDNNDYDWDVEGGWGQCQNDIPGMKINKIK